MKIDFPILWVDDRKTFVNSLLPRLEKWLDEQGFKLSMHLHSSEEGIYDDLKTKDVELIILDYHLRGGKDGDKIIGDIRAKGFWENIIFYSTGGIPPGLFDKPPDGVFFGDKESAHELIKGVIEVKIRRASDLATLRGWVVADSIEIEGKIVGTIRKYFDKHKALSKRRAMKVLSEDGTFFFGRLKGFLSKILDEHIEELTLSEHGIFDFGAKHTMLSGLVRDHIAQLTEGAKSSDVVPKLKGCKAILDSFADEIIAVRNALAHQIAEESESGHKRIKTKTKEAKEMVLDHSKRVEIRKNLRKHYENIETLAALI